MNYQNGITKGRDPRGWFAKGNKIASGNPVNRRMHELRQVLIDSATKADIRDIYASLMESARGGDTAAARLLFEYLVGKAVQAIELSEPVRDPISPVKMVLAIMAAFGDDEAARIKVAQALRRLELAHEAALNNAKN